MAEWLTLLTSNQKSPEGRNTYPRTVTSVWAFLPTLSLMVKILPE